MSQHPRVLRSRLIHLAQVADRRLRMRAKSHIKALEDPAIRAGRAAWSLYLEDAAQARLATLEDGSSPSPDLDLNSPWWCMALTTDPIFLSDDERGDCELLMGLARPGESVDWAAVSRMAPLIYERMAISFGALSTLNLGCPPQGVQSSSPRIHALSPSYGMEGFFDDLDEERGYFNRRRAKRRAGSRAPQAWMDLYGQTHARALWIGGFSRPRAPKALFDDWSQSMAAIAQAMLACGARRVERVPGFFATSPDAMEPGAMELIDAERLDPLRTRWDIESHAGSASPAGPARSL